MRELSSQAGLAIMLLVLAAAWRWGGGRERSVATLVAAGWVGTLAAEAWTQRAAPHLPLAVMDVAVFALLARLTWRHTPDWAMGALACQAIALAVHAVRFLSPAMPTWTFMTALAATSYGVLLCIGWGVWSRQRRRRLGGIQS